MTFAEEVLAMSGAQLKAHLALCMDGCVLTLPPADPTDRENYCRHGETHMYRKRSEVGSDVVDGGSGAYGNQVPLGRAVPMWGGVASGGFGLVIFHERRKLTSEEWIEGAVESGKLVNACKAARPDRTHGPWHVLCDNESFLRASSTAHRGVGVHLWQIAPRSPDLNPVEKYWSWLRRKLRAMDLADLVAKRIPVSKKGLKDRVKRLVQTTQSSEVGRKCAAGLRRVCLEVKRKKGGATRG